MRLPGRVRGAGAVALLVVAAGAAAGLALGGGTGRLVVLATGQLLLLALVLVAWRDLRRANGRLRADLRALGKRSTTAIREATSGSEQRVVESVQAGFKTLGKEQTQHRQKTVDQVQLALRRQFQQIEALGALYYGLRPEQPIPTTRTWAASPDLLRYLYETARRGGLRLVLECGSGVSTLVLAYGLRACGAGRVVALEHEDHYAEVTEELLREHGLEEWAQVRRSPLKSVELAGESWPWYDLPDVPPGPVDLLLVDGPPGATRAHARFPAVPLLYDRLAPGALVVLDDHERDDEREVARRWLEQYPDLITEQLRHEKGTLVLRRPA